MYAFDQLKKGEKTLQQVEKEQEDFKKNLNEITSVNPKHKNTKTNASKTTNSSCTSKIRQ